MHITDIILKKRNGGVLSKEEIAFFVNGYVSGEVADYQAAALLMAIWFKGMDARETTDLTLLMRDSGDVVDLSAIPGVKVDKHSTGGVGDTTTLVCAPLVAACGGKVAKMSGRGLGHTGGTLDKLEAIPGVSVDIPMEKFFDIVNDCGVSVIGQTADLVPADKKMYALRDVTGTVDNISLIASSIMSKKLASGSDAIVLDVKTGSGAFMKDPKAAEDLARAMVEIGNRAGKPTMALVTDMNQPLGNAIGNALEVQEAVEILSGGHPGDLKDVSMALASQMLMTSDICKTEEEAMEKLEAAIVDGSALKALGSMIAAQGGDSRVADDVKLLPQAAKQVSVTARKGGFIHSMVASELGMASLLLGAGRLTKADVIDPAVGFWMKKRLGDKVEIGDELAVFYVNDEKNFDEAVERFHGAIEIKEEKPENFPLIYCKVD